MITSTAGITMIKGYEGFRPTVYKDAAGHDTIGYGHKLTAAEKAAGLEGVTEMQATALLRADLASAERAVNRLVKVPLHQDQFDALVSFTFNVGAGALAESTLLRRLNGGDYAVGMEFLRWDKAGGEVLEGLVRRREAEMRLWQMGTQRLAEVRRLDYPATKQAGFGGLALIMIPFFGLFFGYHLWKLREERK